MPVTMLGFKLQSIQVLHAAQRYTGYDNTVRITGKFHTRLICSVSYRNVHELTTLGQFCYSELCRVARSETGAFSLY